MTASIAGALTLAVILAIGFNIVATRHDRSNGQSAGAAPVISEVRSSVSAGPNT